eukprot:16446055-Heterocapsa_arctica.AAC.1
MFGCGASECLPGAPVQADALGDLDLGLRPSSASGCVSVETSWAFIPLALVSLGNASWDPGGLSRTCAAKSLRSSWPPDSRGPS